MADVWYCRPPLGTPIDRNNPLARGLLAFVDADGDRVSGAPLSLMGGAVRRADGTLYSPGADTDGAYVDCPSLATITTDFTLVSFCAIASLAQDAFLLGVPYRAGSEELPYTSMALARYGTASVLLAAWSDADQNRTIVAKTSQPMLVADNVISCRAFGKSLSGVVWYKDGQSWTDFRYLAGNVLTRSPYLSNGQPLTIGNYSSSYPSQAVGGVFGPQLVYARTLSQEEIRLIHANPWRIFAPRRVWYYPVVTATPGAALCAVSARSPDASPLAVAEATLAGIAVAARNARTYWCAGLDAWTDFASEWADEETTWQPVSTAVSTTPVSISLAAISPIMEPAITAALTAAGFAASALAAAGTGVASAETTPAGLGTSTHTAASASDAIGQAVAAALTAVATEVSVQAAVLADATSAWLAASALAASVTISVDGVIAQVSAAAMALAALTPATASSSTGTTSAAVMTVTTRDAIGAALARVEAAVVRLGMVATTAATSSACVADTTTAGLAAILGDHAGLPIAIVAPDAATASLVAQSVSILAETAAPATAAVLSLVARSITAGTGTKEVVRLASPITTSVWRQSPFSTVWQATSPIVTNVRLRSTVETEQT